MSYGSVSAAPALWSLTGKMPSAGDYLRRNLEPATAARLDDWLDVELSRWAAQDADGWSGRFIAAGPCRFRLGRDVFGAHPVHGVIAPSRDAVGRGYALIAFSAAPVATPEAVACVTEALDEAASADALLLRLGALAQEAIDEQATPASRTGFWVNDVRDARWLEIEGLPAGVAFDRVFAPANAEVNAIAAHVEDSHEEAPS